jgi:hypothetical protein
VFKNYPWSPKSISKQNQSNPKQIKAKPKQKQDVLFVVQNIFLGCGGSVGESNWATPDRGRSCPGFASGSPHSLLNGARKYDCVSYNKSQHVRRLCLSKNQLNKKKVKIKNLFYMM